MRITRQEIKEASESLDKKLKEDHNNRISVNTNEFRLFLSGFYHESIKQIESDSNDSQLLPALQECQNIQNHYKQILETVHANKGYDRILVPLTNMTGQKLSFILEDVNKDLIERELDQYLFSLLNTKGGLQNWGKRLKSQAKITPVLLEGEEIYSPKGELIISHLNEETSRLEHHLFGYSPAESIPRIIPESTKLVLDLENERMITTGEMTFEYDNNILVPHKTGNYSLEHKEDLGPNLESILKRRENLLTITAVGENLEHEQLYNIAAPIVAEVVLDRYAEQNGL